MAETTVSLAAWQELKGEPAGQRWLRRHPSRIERCIEERAGALPEPLAADELEELRKSHRDWCADPKSLESIEVLGRRETRVVIAGQQPGFLAGPLLIVYKAAAAVKLAAELAQRHPELRFVPVFWAASEDHDFGEIRRAYWPGQSGLEEAYIQPSLWEPGQMVGLVQTESVVNGLIGQIEQTTYRTEFRDRIVALLRQAYGSPAATIEFGFCRLLLTLLAGSGLVVVSPLMNWVRRRGAAVMERELERAGQSTAVVLARAEEMRAAGVQPPIHRTPDALNGFWVDDQGRRYALHHENGAIHRVLAESHEELPPTSASELIEQLHRDPSCVSPNVVTRPIVQDAILPTVTHVVGPGEAAYFSQVEPAYDGFGVFAPVRWPRPEILLIEPRVARNLEKYEVELDDALRHDPEELMEKLFRREMEQGVLGQIESVRARHQAENEALYHQVGMDAPAVRAAFDKLNQALEKSFKAVEERVLQQRAEDEAHVGRALAIVSASVRPAGLPQERALNPVVPFAINYGIDWALRLLGEIDTRPDRPMQVIALSELPVKDEGHGHQIELEPMEQG
ncbi:bacillithiol biosynthesis cysteine-adding enzyme BshC [bacterium]|nr:bacillithiol biosynthesis cysteine-adding enzyme BshC [bacterium]